MRSVQLSDVDVELSIETTPDTPSDIVTDQRMLRQILVNLVGNSVRFTEKGRIRVKVDWRKGPQASDLTLLFEVHDTGCGIDSKNIEDLFEPFAQRGLDLLRKQGAGLGLPLSKHFVDMLGGSIAIESIVGQETSVFFSIPVQVVKNSADTLRNRPLRVVALAEGQPNYRILIVEDVNTNRLILKQYLTRVGFDVREAVNGEEAVEIWQQWEPNLIWMDMQMPVMDGLTATRHIRRQEIEGHTVIIALTANVYQNDLDETIVAGCDAYATKPFIEKEIFDLMSSHLGAEYIYAERNYPI